MRGTHLLSVALGFVTLGFVWSCGDVDRDSAAQGMAALDPGGQTVLFWHQYSGARGEALQDLIDLFNATNPEGVTVRGETFRYHSEVYDRMLQGIHGASLPDLVVAYQNQAQAYYQAGAVIDLIPYMTSDRWGLTDVERADYFPSFLAQDNVDGVQTAFLPNRSMEILYYNQAWLEELGYTEPPRNWSQFADMCRAAARQPFSGSLSPDEPSLGFLLDRDASRLASMIFSRGGDVIAADGSAYTFDTPEATAALQMMRDLIVEKAAGLVSERDADPSRFSAGQCLFAMRSSSGLPALLEEVKKGADFEWNVGPVPYEGERPIQNVYGASLAVCASNPEKQLAPGSSSSGSPSPSSRTAG
jgi:multiple sugar transport system substrate-binding protein/sn-glycerol 3-phosphate transport system substrate-binding protein